MQQVEERSVVGRRGRGDEITRGGDGGETVVAAEQQGGDGGGDGGLRWAGKEGGRDGGRREDMVGRGVLEEGEVFLDERVGWGRGGRRRAG